jgi:type I restriction enzyme S subunit
MTMQMPLFSEGAREAVRAQLDIASGDDVAVQRLIENFDVLIDAGAGVERLRGLVLLLAVQGRLLQERPLPIENTPTSEGLSPPHGLPVGWQWKRVDEVGDLKLGRQRSPKNHSGPNMRPYLRVANVFEGRIDTRDVLEMNFEPEEAERFLLQANDLLLNEGQSYELVGRPAIYRGEVPEACFQNTLIRFRPSRAVLPEFALAVFRAYMRTGRFMREAQQTTNIAHLSLGRLACIEFPLPPVAEQKRIVAKVDQLMALCDDLEARQSTKREVGARLTKSALEALTAAEGPEQFEVAWERVREHLPILVRRAEDVACLRTAVLGIACCGRLSANAGIHGETGDELIAKILARRASRRRVALKQGARAAAFPPEGRADVALAAPQLPPTWTVCGVDDLLAPRASAMKAGPFGSALTKSMYVPRGYKVYGQEQVIRGDPFFGSYYVDEQKYESLKTCAVAPGDMLISLMGTVGKVLILPANCEQGIINPRLLKLSLDEEVVSEYLRLYLTSPFARSHIEASARGIAMDGLNIAILRLLPIALPGREEQSWIVNKVATLMTVCDELEEKLRRGEARASKLVEAVVAELCA